MGTGHQVFIAIMIAAATAAAVTELSAPAGNVEADQAAKPVETAVMASVDQPWPYMHRVVTPLGNSNFRLITTDRLAP
jgi:hypothetical protein